MLEGLSNPLLVEILHPEPSSLEPMTEVGDQAELGPDGSASIASLGEQGREAVDVGTQGARV
jgi:hypothetical protein